jgi:hypothetical protein
MVSPEPQLIRILISFGECIRKARKERGFYKGPRQTLWRREDTVINWKMTEVEACGKHMRGLGDFMPQFVKFLNMWL